MRLYYAGPSPYARKVRVVIAEKGLDDKIDLHFCNPYEDTAELRAVNPLCKVPCLVLGDGSPLYDSRVIADYLDSLGGGPRLIPQDGAARWTALRQHALGEGILDAAFATVMETRRPENERSSTWPERWQAAIENSLAVMESEIESLTPDISLTHIVFGCALGYLDFRLGHLNWRGQCPKTAAWYETFSGRPAMVATHPES